MSSSSRPCPSFPRSNSAHEVVQQRSPGLPPANPILFPVANPNQTEFGLLLRRLPENSSKTTIPRLSTGEHRRLSNTSCAQAIIVLTAATPTVLPARTYTHRCALLGLHQPPTRTRLWNSLILASYIPRKPLVGRLVCGPCKLIYKVQYVSACMSHTHPVFPLPRPLHVSALRGTREREPRPAHRRIPPHLAPPFFPLQKPSFGCWAGRISPANPPSPTIASQLPGPCACADLASNLFAVHTPYQAPFQYATYRVKLLVINFCQSTGH